jgi:hypothetical protein
MVAFAVPAAAQEEPPVEPDFKALCEEVGYDIQKKSGGKNHRSNVKDDDSTTDRCLFLGKGKDKYQDTEDTAESDSEAVIGEKGNDTIDLRDGDGQDFVACGPGEDTVFTDVGDTILDPEACENVNPVDGPVEPPVEPPTEE